MRKKGPFFLQLFSDPQRVMYVVLRNKKRFFRLLSPLFCGQLDVVLHPHVDHVPGRAEEAAGRSRHRRHGHARQEGDLLAIRGHLLLRNLEQITEMFLR